MEKFKYLTDNKKINISIEVSKFPMGTKSKKTNSWKTHLKRLSDNNKPISGYIKPVSSDFSVEEAAEIIGKSVIKDFKRSNLQKV